jgi:hypothetical protein
MGNTRCSLYRLTVVISIFEFFFAVMDTTDSAICLEDIRAVKLTVNAILQLVRSGIPTEVASPQPPSPVLPTTELNSKLSKILRLLQSTTATTTIPTSTTSLPPEDFMGGPVTDRRCESPDPNETFVILSLVSLGVWLALVLLALTWMRYYDLRYRPRVVSCL